LTALAQKRFIWQVFPAFLLITLLSLVLVSFFLTRTVEKLHLAQTERDLHARARLLAPLTTQFAAKGDHAALQARCIELGKDSATRITLLEKSGRVVADSDESPSQMNNHADRPEIQRALAGETGHSLRFSQTVDKRMMYVALPASDASRGLIIRAAIPITTVGDVLRTVNSQMVFVVLIVTLLAAGLSWIVSRRVVRPLAELKVGAERFARGDLEHPLPVPESEEFASLTDALNQMAHQLAGHIQAVEQQRYEQEAVLSSMIESVVAIDADLRIITVNNAASALLGLSLSDIKGQTLLETVHSKPLLEFARCALSSESMIEQEIQLEAPSPILLRAQGTVLHDSNGHSMGAVIVLENITRLRQLEEVRQDFVANVSHELKTPITSIKGFVETLLDDRSDWPDDTRHFLGIIEKQANRLDAIIDDLLTLSRLEQGNGRATLKLGESAVIQTIEAAAELCQHRADSRGVDILIECPVDLVAPINAPLLEQGLVNLIDNAVKYSDEMQHVVVRAYDDDDALVIDVIDEGSGIPAADVDRIFERFYRVDRARSRDLGGTGLGLSIVKHIAQVHGGTVSVASAPGKGSTFTFRLPLSHQVAP